MRLETLSVRTRQRRQMVNVTSEVRDTLRKSGCKDGWMLLTILHTTCGLLLNDANSGWEEDMLAFLERAVPKLDFHHLHDGPEHAKSHILGALLGASLTIGIADGRPVLGTWQSIFVVELEGPRDRSLAVQIYPAS